MNTAGRLAAFATAVGVVAAGGWALGSAVGSPNSTPVVGHAMAPMEAPARDQALPGGLATSRGGYTLVADDTSLAAGVEESFRYRVVGADGAALMNSYEVKHDKLMHLVVVRRDGSNYQHVHPELSEDGVWRVPLTLREAGTYRLFADFAPAGGEAMTLGIDVAVPGDFQPVQFPESRVADLDGYRVELTGDLVAGRSSPVTARVFANGEPVTDLQPYLAAFGHLVALRQGDLAYLHVHPDGNPGDGRTPAGPDVKFYIEVPSDGGYRLAFDFQHQGVVRTAGFTVSTTRAATPPAAAEATVAPPAASHPDTHSGGH